MPVTLKFEEATGTLCTLCSLLGSAGLWFIVFVHSAPLLKMTCCVRHTRGSLVSMVCDSAGKSVLMLPVGQGDDGAHSQNEKFARANYINAIKVLGVYLRELADLSIGRA